MVSHSALQAALAADRGGLVGLEQRVCGVDCFYGVYSLVLISVSPYLCRGLPASSHAMCYLVGWSNPPIVVAPPCVIQLQITPWSSPSEHVPTEHPNEASYGRHRR